MKQGYLAVAFLLLQFIAYSQTWVQENSYQFPITSLFYDPEGNVFVTNQDGRLFVNGTIHDTLDVLYEFGNEHGLVTVAEFDGLLYFHLTCPDSFQRVVSYDPIEKIILDTFIEIDYRYPPTPNHFGGGLIVRDSFLFASFGVGNDDTLAQGNSGHGAVIKVDLYEGSSYVYANGLRNPFRLAYWDWLEELWAFDPGGVWEEANVIYEDGNYGWPIVNGTDSTNMYDNPIFQYSDPTAAIIGGVFYQDEFWFCDHFPVSGGMAKGWRLGINGDTTNQNFPGYTTCMAVNPVDSSLHLVTWSGKQYMYEGQPLSIDSAGEKPYIDRYNKDFEYWLEDMIYYYGDIHFSVDGKMFKSVPAVTGFYYSYWRKTWIFVP